MKGSQKVEAGGTASKSKSLTGAHWHHLCEILVSLDPVGLVEIELGLQLGRSSTRGQLAFRFLWGRVEGPNSAALKTRGGTLGEKGHGMSSGEDLLPSLCHSC